MAVIIFALLALLAAAAIVYPLLSGRTRTVAGPDDAEIEQAVHRLREARRRVELACPSCGRPYQAGDRFCVGCGEALPTEEPAHDDAQGPAAAILICPSCGARLRAGDQFCARCGHRLAAEEVA